MPVVRKQANEVSRAASDGGYSRVSVSADAFGAQTGRAVQGLGQEIGQAAQVLQARDERLKQDQVKAALTSYQGQVENGLLYGENGLYSQAGEAAINAVPTTQEAMRSAREAAAAGLKDPRQQALFKAAADQTELDWNRQIGSFQVRQQKTFALSSSAGRQAQAETTFQRAFGVDDESATKAWAVTRAEIVEQGKLGGEAPEMIQAAIDKKQSDLLSGVVEAQAQDDPIKARETLTRYEDKIDPIKAARLGKDIRAMADQREATQIAEGVPVVGGAREIISYVIDEHEGEGLNPNDNGRPSKFGVRADAADGTYKGLKVADLTRAQAEEIYQRDFWKPSGAADLVKSNPGAAYVLYDAAVNHGVGYAKKLRAAAGDDPKKMIDLRLAEYSRLAKADPAQYGDDLAGWQARMRKLQVRIGGLKLTTAAEAEQYAVDLGGGDPERTKTYRGVFDAKLARDKSIERDTREDLVNEVWKHAETATSENQIPPTLWNRLKPQDRDAFRSQMKGNATGAKVVTDAGTYGGLYDLAASDPHAFASADLTKLVGQLSGSDYQELVKLQLTARQGGGAWKQESASLEAVNRAAGLVLPPSMKVTDPKAKELKGAMFRAAQAATQLKGAPLTDEEMVGLGGKLVADQVIGEGLFGAKARPLYQVKPGDVPKDARERILKDWYARHKQPITDDQIAQAYQTGRTIGAFQ